MPVIGISAGVFEEDRKNALNSGMDAFVAKPFKAQDLPKTGDSKAGYVLGELTLECRGEKGQAIIKDLKTA